MVNVPVELSRFHVKLLPFAPQVPLCAKLVTAHAVQASKKSNFFFIFTEFLCAFRPKSAVYNL
jgi:hypothetical protein